MPDLEFLVTDGAYISELSEPATYTDQSNASRAIRVVPEQNPEQFLPAAQVNVRGVRYEVRVRVSEVAQPCKGDRLQYFDVEYCVDEFDRLNVAEWLLYVVA